MKYLASQLSELKVDMSACCTPIIKDILGGFFDGLSTSANALAVELKNSLKTGYLKNYEGFYKKTVDGYILDEELVNHLWGLVDYCLDLSNADDKIFYESIHGKFIQNQLNYVDEKGIFTTTTMAKMTRIQLVEAPELPGLDARWQDAKGNFFGLIFPPDMTIITDYLRSDKC